MPSHYLNQCWHIVDLTIRKSVYIFIQENAFENVVCKIGATFRLCWPQRVNKLQRSPRRKWPVILNVYFSNTAQWYIELPTSPRHCAAIRALFHYPIRRLIVRSHKVSKPRDLHLELYDRPEIWQAPRQQCCWCACQISKRCDNLSYQSRSFEASWDLTIRRLIGYWNGPR